MPPDAGQAPFATIHDVLEAAHRSLPAERWDYVAGGGGDEAALRRNRRALDAICLLPRVLRDVSVADTAVRFAGLDLALPVMVAPIGGIELVHAEAAVGLARGASAAGTTAWISTAASPTLEEVAASVDVSLGFQLYVAGSRQDTAELVRRAIDAGYSSLCLTVDTAVSARRERDLRHGFDPRERRMPNTADLAPGRLRPALSWDDVEWLRTLTGELPLVLKGILDPRDAVRAVESGADGIIVSNHGGRQADVAPAGVEVLPAIAAAVGGRVQLAVDGGISSGSDIVRALALGADAVCIGRLACWGLAAGGAATLGRVIGLLGEELRIAMGLLGVTTLAALRDLEVLGSGGVGGQP